MSWWISHLPSQKPRVLSGDMWWASFEKFNHTVVRIAGALMVSAQLWHSVPCPKRPSRRSAPALDGLHTLNRNRRDDLRFLETPSESVLVNVNPISLVSTPIRLKARHGTPIGAQGNERVGGLNEFLAKQCQR